MAGPARSLFGTLVHNALSTRLNRGLLGTTLEADAGEVRAEEVAAYLGALRGGPPGGAAPPPGPGDAVTPFFLARLAFPAFQQTICHRELGLNLLRMVHAESRLESLRPLRVGDRPRVRLTLTEVEQTRAGELLRLRAEAVVAGQPVASATLGFMVRAWRRRKKRAPAEVAPPPAEAFRLPLQTEEGQHLAYAAASRDRNFIHVSELAARLSGLPRTILHGMCVLGMSGHALADRLCQGDPARVALIAARHAAMVLPGQALTLVAFAAQADGAVPFEVRTPRGALAIKHGQFKLR